MSNESQRKELKICLIDLHYKRIATIAKTVFEVSFDHASSWTEGCNYIKSTLDSFICDHSILLEYIVIDKATF